MVAYYQLTTSSRISICWISIIRDLVVYYQLITNSRITINWISNNRDAVVYYRLNTSSRTTISWLSIYRDLVVYYQFTTREELLAIELLFVYLGLMVSSLHPLPTHGAQPPAKLC